MSRPARSCLDQDHGHDRAALTHAERALAIVSSQPTVDPDLASFVETRDAARAAVRRGRR